MALSRAMLKGMGLTEEQADAIINEHTATVDGLKAQRDEFKESLDKATEDSKKVTKLEKELQELKESNELLQSKYDKEHSDFDEYKKNINAKELADKKQNAYRKLLKETGVSETGCPNALWNAFTSSNSLFIVLYSPLII